MRTTILCLALAACSWGRFDDLKRDTGVGLAERPDGVTGNLGVAIGPAGTAGADEAGAFVASANGPTGLVRYVIRANGDIEAAGSAEGTQQGSGDLAPVSSAASVVSIAKFDDGHFVVGAPTGAGNLIALFENKIALGGSQLFPSPNGIDVQVGSAVAAGDLGVGGSPPDVAAASQNGIYVVADGITTTTPAGCGLRQPQPPSFSIGNNASAFTKNVVIANVGGGPKVIASGSDFNRRSWVKIFAAPTSLDLNADCPAQGILIQDVDNVNLAPFALAVGDADGGTLDLLASTLPPDSGGGVASPRVCLYPSLTPTTPASSCIEVPSPESAGGTGIVSSKRRGARVLLANIDGAAGDEVIVSDPAASIDGKTAGAVAIYKLAGGTFTLIQTLFPNDADGTENFGRDLAAIPFRQTTLLAVGMNDKVVIYFKPLPASTDPRN